VRNDDLKIKLNKIIVSNNFENGEFKIKGLFKSVQVEKLSILLS
jgi:hypothetical protein